MLHVSVSDELAEEGHGAEDEEDPDHAVQPVLPVHPVPDTVDRRLLLHDHYQYQRRKVIEKCILYLPGDTS